MPLDINKIKEYWQANKQKIASNRNFDRLNYFKIKKNGTYKIRLLEIYDFDIMQHWNVVKHNDTNLPLNCPKAYDGSECPICSAVESFGVSQEPEEQNLAKKWIGRKGYPLLVLDLQDEENKNKPKLYIAPWTVYNEIFSLMINPDYPEYAHLRDLEKGRNLSIVRTKPASFVEYSVLVAPSPSSVDIDPETFPDIRKALKPLSAEDITYCMMNGEFPKKDKQEEEDDIPRSVTEEPDDVDPPAQAPIAKPEVKVVQKVPEAILNQKKTVLTDKKALLERLEKARLKK